MKEQQTDGLKQKVTLGDEIRLYIEKRLELLNLVVAEEIAQLISDGIQQMIGVLLLSAALLFSWLAFAFLLSEWVNSLSGGFALASLPLFLLTFIFIKKRSRYLSEKIQAELIEKAILKFDEKVKNRAEGTVENE